MGWYSRSTRFILHDFCRYNSKIVVARNPIRSTISEYSQPIFRNGLKRRQLNSPFLVGAKRFYYGLPRGYKRWIEENPTAAVFMGSVVVITLFFGNLETVPYTKRTHFVVLPSAVERKLGDIVFKKMKAKFKGKILPPLDPVNIRVQRISQDIIGALHKGLTKEHIRNKGEEKGRKSLEGLKWEVIVVNKPVINAFCLPGGKIFVFTGLLEHFTADAEVATIIGHEVSHAVARHHAEQISKNLWLVILQIILYQFFKPDIVNIMSDLLLRRPFSRRMEMEADYMGMLLLASAGYDPRVAPQVYEKLGRVAGDSLLQDYLKTHPSSNKRAKLLAQAKVMEEALSIYWEVQPGHADSLPTSV